MVLLASIAWHAARGRVAAGGGADSPGHATKRAAAVTPAARAAINRGLEQLVRRQHEDGSFGSGQYDRNVAVTALAGMALLASGSTPGRGPYGKSVNHCVAFVLDHCQQSGLIIAESAASHGPMYGHGFATLFLAETYGMSLRSDLREKLIRAVRLIIDCQNNEGGWRYLPRRKDADISVTVCQVMALRAARNAGIFVPRATIDRAVQYVQRCQNQDGGFRYMLAGGQSAFPRSAAGVVTLFSAGIYDAPAVRKGIDYLMRHLPRDAARSREGHYFYGHYYAVQAMWQIGGKPWRDGYPTIRDALCAQQKKDGMWASPYSREYGTAMALLILQMPDNVLPIFQR